MNFLYLKGKTVTTYIYGYEQVSTRQQELNRKLDLLKQYNCHEILTEKMSRTKAVRPELIRFKDKLRPGYMVVVGSLS